MSCATFCKIMDLFLRDARYAAAAMAGLSAVALGGAYFSQYVLGMAPCILCLYQRIPHALIILLGLGAFFLARRGQAKRASFALFIAALVALAGALLAGYHTGVEQHWWVSHFEGCAADLSGGDLMKQIESSMAVRCDTVPWSLFGISMAGYNALLSAGMAGYAALSSILITRRANGF